MQELGKLFDSEDRVKIIRLFLGKKDDLFQIEDIFKKTKVKIDNLNRELLILEKSGLIKKSKEKFSVFSENSKTKSIKQKECIYYCVNKKFRFLNSLSVLMFDFKNANIEVLLERFKNIGRIKYLMVSGVFTEDQKARCDIMYIGESLKKNLVDKLLIDLESELGIKLNILIFDLEEFNYRYKMFDRLVRDALKDNKQVLVNKLSL